jgi:hypothetical protein
MNEYEVERMPLVTDSNRSVSFFFGLGVGSIDVCVERNAMEWGIGDDYTLELCPAGR